MAYQQYRDMFLCPKCNKNGPILMVKISGQKIIIKKKCPKHGTRVIKPPLMALDQIIDLIREATYRCRKCGRDSMATWMKADGPWTLMKVSCPTHGTQSVQRIWNIIYTQISTMPATTPQVVAAPPIEPNFHQSIPENISQPIIPQSIPEPTPTPETRFCPTCGSDLESDVKFCHTCGNELD